MNTYPVVPLVRKTITHSYNNEELNEIILDDKVGAGDSFERTRRITGYLVGTLARFNNAKLSEERDRLRHSV